MNQYLDLLARYRICFLSGVPSAIAILAQHALAIGWTAPSSLRGVLPASEALFPHQRQLIGRAFGHLPVIGQYGMSERVAIAGELLSDPDTYEFEPLYGIAELIDDVGERISTPGQSGRIICTGLFSKAMALIRYDVGDRATLIQAPSFDNCFRLQVRAIRSRWAQEFVIGRSGQKISVIALDQENYFGVIREYQFLQLQPGHVTVRAVPCPGKTSNEINRILDPMRARVRDQLTFDVELVAQLPVGATGKRKVVDQRIPETAS
jgi:phenylacetate-CoA ligase